MGASQICMHRDFSTSYPNVETPFGFALRVRPSGFARCSTWGDPKTALAYHLLYLGRPQDRSGLTSCSTWGDPKTALAHDISRLYKYEMHPRESPQFGHNFRLPLEDGLEFYKFYRHVMQILLLYCVFSYIKFKLRRQ